MESGWICRRPASSCVFSPGLSQDSAVSRVTADAVEDVPSLVLHAFHSDVTVVPRY